MAKGQKSAAQLRRERRAEQGYMTSQQAKFKTGNRREDKSIGAFQIAHSQTKAILANQAEIVQQSRAELVAGSVIAARFLVECVRGNVEGASVTNRIESSKILLNAAGVIGKDGAAGADSKGINTMTRAELEEFARGGAERLQRLRQQSQAVTVDQQSPTVEPD